MSKSVENAGPTVFLRDALRRTVEKQTEDNCTVLYDDRDIPSYMLRIPRFNVETIDSSMGHGVHPAFVVDGKEVSEIFVGMKNAKIIEGRAYSILGESETRGLNFDEARKACTEKGKGWHMLNAWEWAAVAAWVIKNNSHEYFHRGWWDWVDGLKLVDGEIFVPHDNNFELPESEWPSLKVFFDDNDGAPILAEKITKYSEENPRGIEDDRDDDYTHLDRLADLKNADPLMAARETLVRLLIEPLATPIFSETSGSLYVRNYGERLPFRGGNWNSGANAGLGYLNLINRRVGSGSDVGFRPAFIGV